MYIKKNNGRLAFLFDLAILAMLLLIIYYVKEPISKVLFALFFTYLVFYKTKEIFYIFVVTYPFTYLNYSKLVVGSVKLEIDDILLLILSLISLVKIILKFNFKINIHKMPKYVRSSIVLILSFLLFVFCSDLVNGANFSSFIQHLGFILTFCLTILYVQEEKTFEDVVLLLKIAAFIMAMSAILTSMGTLDVLASDELSDTKPAYVRAMPGMVCASTGFVASRGGFGINIAFVLPFVLNSIFSFNKNTLRSGLVKSVCYVGNVGLLFVLLLGVYVSGSRSTWLMSFVVLTFYLFSYLRMKIGLRATVLISFFFSSLVLFLSFNFLGSLLYEIYGISPEGVDSRMIVNVEALNLFLTHPLLGSSQADIAAHSSQHIVIHNFFIDIATRFGIGAIVTIIALFAYIFVMLVNIMRSGCLSICKYSICLFMGMLGMLISLSFYGGGEKQMWLYMALPCGLYIVYSRLLHNKVPRKSVHSCSLGKSHAVTCASANGTF